MRVLRNQINAPQEQKDINESKKPAASEKKPSRALVKVGNEVLRNIPPKLELQESLPVSERADEIAEAIKNNQVVIVSGETGSGKTTQLPKIAMMVGRGQKGLHL